MELFQIIQQLAVSEASLWSILDGLKSNVTYVSFFCREYWGTSGSMAPVSIERLECNERLKRQVQQACVLESLSMGVVAHLCSGVMHGVTVTIQSRLRNLLYYIHENSLVLMDLVCQRWLNEGAARGDQKPSLHCPENLNFDILVRVKRYRRLQRGAHLMALRQHNEMIVNVLRQLCRGAATKRPATSSRAIGSPGARSPQSSRNVSVLSLANEILAARNPLDQKRAWSIRAKMLQCMYFKPLLANGTDPECPWPSQDPYERYGAHRFNMDAPVIWFEPLPPMYPDLDVVPKLPPVAAPDMYTLVLDLDETLVHYYEEDGMGNFDIRPGMHEFVHRMHSLGYEVVVFTAATQDYADWVMDQIDPQGCIHYRLYRQHALPWGPIFIKDLSQLGRDLDRMLIIDNVQENFMLQPNNGIFILPWYDDPHDTALFSLTPLLDELIRTRARVPDLLDKYRDQIPAWAGFDQYMHFGGDYSELGQGITDDFLAQEQEDVHAQMQAVLAHSYSSPVQEVASTPQPPPSQLQQSSSAPCTATYYLQQHPKGPLQTERAREQEAVRVTQAGTMPAISPAPSPSSTPYPGGGLTATLSGGYLAGTSPGCATAYLHAAAPQLQRADGPHEMQTVMLQVGGPAPPRTQRAAFDAANYGQTTAPQQTARVAPAQPAAAQVHMMPRTQEVRSAAPQFHAIQGVAGPYQSIPSRPAAAVAAPATAATPTTIQTPASSPGVTSRATAQVAPASAFMSRAGFGPHQMARR